MLDSRWPLIAGASLLLAGAPALADDPERLEADLRAMFGGHGSFELGEVSGALLRRRATAEDLVFETDEGERLRLARYIVKGDYDSPDEVILEGLRLEDGLTELPLMSAERIVLGEPSRAVFPLDGDLAPEEVRIGSLAIDDIVIDMASELAEELFQGAAFREGGGRLTIARVRGESLSRDAIGMLEITEVAGTGQDLGDLGAGSFTLGSLRLEGLAGLEGAGEETLELLAIRDIDIASDRLVATLAELDLDGDFSDGIGGLSLDGIRLDLARMIELAPEQERAQLRMASKVLTDGSGELRLDATFLGDWEEEGGRSILRSNSRVTVHEALRLLIDIELPVVLPDGVSPEAVFSDADLLEAATLLGGEIHLTLADQGLFGRLATLGAAMEGVTEAQYLEQVRTQAQGFGMLFGPQVQAVLTGLVDLMAGAAEELEVGITLPAESNLETWAGDPMALPDKLSLSVETR
ncbi:hypothetical protein MKP05_09940 [Halomonas sp. EGI 63088]|uniref:DUF2125 domain-containing protein n=1 Tax=Halomonas flagellata TaxID=2920385 RepID=A0ABS9RUB2_9GAMM|nr:hypothetical protein [Halomonas flagellata]